MHIYIYRLNKLGKSYSQEKWNFLLDTPTPPAHVPHVPAPSLDHPGDMDRQTSADSGGIGEAEEGRLVQEVGEGSLTIDIRIPIDMGMRYITRLFSLFLSFFLSLSLSLSVDIAHIILLTLC